MTLDISQICVAAIGLIQGVLVALIARQMKRDKEDKEEKAAQDNLRTQESRLSMAMMSADMSLSVATAHALREGKVNGVMSAALDKADKAQEEYFTFINEVAAHQITKK